MREDTPATWAPVTPSPIITLTTDFGRHEPWVGIMKGVILSICPGARLVDLTHEIPPFDVLAGQLALEAAVSFFPPGSVHLAVVDPGVGSARRPLLVESGGHRFVGPDNGLFTFALDALAASAVALESPALRLPVVSGTFHGRDVFAPAAAHAALGVPAERFGRAVRDPVLRSLPRAAMQGDALVGEVIAADRFGNLITSVREEDMARLGGGPLAVSLGEWSLGAPRASYTSGEPGQPAPIMGSGGRLEVFVREGSAASVLMAGPGASVTVRRGPALGGGP